MKLATQRTDNIDGRLIVVSKDMQRAVNASRISTTMQDAIERWDTVHEDLEQLSQKLNAGEEPEAFDFNPREMDAPLPRAWQWLDGSAFPSHANLMTTAFGISPLQQERPLMYQGMSHHFAGPCDEIVLPSSNDGIDFEGELGIVTSQVPMGVEPNDAAGLIRLVVLINDWSLRVTGAEEMKTGFGWLQAKPACSMAALALTPDEFGPAWADGRLDLVMNVELNGQPFGAVRSTEMMFGFPELIAHAAATRYLCAGTILGSGTVSSNSYKEMGSCCIAEKRAIEIIENGEPTTKFMEFGDVVRINATDLQGRQSFFGEIHQRVTRLNR